MTYTYAQLEKQFATRRKSRDYKVMHQHLEMRHVATTGQFVFTRKVVKWVRNDSTFTYDRKESLEPFCTIDKDNVFTMLATPKCDDNTAKNLVNKLTGLSVWSSTSRYKMYEYQLRVTARTRARQPDRNFPLSEGFKFDILKFEVLHAEPDVKKKTNRKASSPILDYIDKVIKTMKVMIRLGALDSTNTSIAGGRNALQASNLIDMTDDNIAKFAEVAFVEADSRGDYISPRVANRDKATGMYVWTQRTPEQLRELVVQRRCALAKRRLTDYLKEKHGAYDKVTL